MTFLGNDYMGIKVLQVFASLDMGGAECRMMDVYRFVDKDQIQFDFVTLQEGAQYFEHEIESLGGKVIKIPSPRKVGVRNHISALRECMRSGGYNAVHAHTSYHCGIVMFAANKEGIPVRIAHARTNDSIQRDIKTKAYIAFGRALINRYSTNKLAISEASGRFVFGHNNFEIVPNSIDLDLYKNICEDEINDVRREFNLSVEQTIIGHVGRFDRFKNQRFVIDVFQDYLKTNPHSRLVLIGDGELKQELQQYAKELNIDREIIFTGVRSDIPVWMNLFDVLMFPSVIEGLGGVVLEAQAAGTPAVISDNVPDSVDVGLNLIKRCSLDADKLSWINKINESVVMAKPEQDLIRNCFDKSGYSLSSSAKRYVEIYKGKTINGR